MDKSRLFLKLTSTEHNILTVAKAKMHARSYRDIIVTMLDGEYIDYVCNSVLTEKVLRKIIVNLNQLSRGCGESKAFTELVTMITNSAAILADWNNIHLQPVFSHRETPKELQIRLTREEKDIAKAAKSAAGFRTYSDLVMHLCCAFISDSFNLPGLVDYTAFNDVGKALNAETKYYNTYDDINEEALNNILDNLYELTMDLNKSISAAGGYCVS